MGRMIQLVRLQDGDPWSMCNAFRHTK